MVHNQYILSFIKFCQILFELSHRNESVEDQELRTRKRTRTSEQEQTEETDLDKNNNYKSPVHGET